MGRRWLKLELFFLPSCTEFNEFKTYGAFGKSERLLPRYKLSRKLSKVNRALNLSFVMTSEFVGLASI